LSSGHKILTQRFCGKINNKWLEGRLEVKALFLRLEAEALG